jgi:DNA helicase-2/ATP-dependent DNA helicase PcrA
MDFTGILERARKELQNPDLAEFLSDQYIFLDEGQDTNPYNEWPILQKLYDGCLGFTIFASPSQQIYAFRGADWEQLSKLFPEDRVTESMLENRRSTPQIVKASSGLAGDDAKNMIPVNPDGVPVLWVDAINPDMELDYIAAQVAKWLNSGTIEKPSQIAILTRVHNQLFPVQRVLRARGITTTLMSQKHNPFTRVETRALLGYLQLAADPMSDLMLEDIIDYPSCGIGSRRRYQLRRDEDLSWDHLAMALAYPDDHPEQVINRIYQILDVRADLDELNKCNLPVHERVAKAIDMTGISVQLLADGDYNGVRALDDLTKASKEYSSLEEFAEYLSEELEKPRETEGVKLGTLHASKGLEWEAVIMPSMQDGSLPMAGGDKLEERNLAFVGVSRPKQRLVLVSNAASAPSPYIHLAQQEAIKWPRKR